VFTLAHSKNQRARPEGIAPPYYTFLGESSPICFTKIYANPLGSINKTSGFILTIFLLTTIIQDSFYIILVLDEKSEHIIIPLEKKISMGPHQRLGSILQKVTEETENWFTILVASGKIPLLLQSLTCTHDIHSLSSLQLLGFKLIIYLDNGLVPFFGHQCKKPRMVKVSEVKNYISSINHKRNTAFS
jgi:hypothetical protein